VSQVALLVTEEMRPIPADVKVIVNWEEVSVLTGDAQLIVGRHMTLEGTFDAIKSWLRPFKSVWVQKGAPILQQFELKEVA
jgi:hypothetical protein